MKGFQIDDSSIGANGSEQTDGQRENAVGKSLAQELASRNITVNAVAPGFIETDMTNALKDEQKARITQGIPMGRIGTAAEVAAAVRFLASEEASYITGNVIDVNGGMYMR